ELTTQIESICFTEVKGDGDDCKVNESLSKDKDSKNSDVLHVGVKGLKRKRLSNNDEVDSVANVIFEKVKGFFNCHPQGVMNNNNSGYRPIDTNELYDQELHHNGSFLGFNNSL
ncbi:hypothetical protein Tco_0125778, partial [Tanacetum coccineum]